MSNLKDKIEISITEGLDFLAKEQKSDGSFFSETLPGEEKHESPFFTSLIAISLSGISDNHRAKEIASKACNFLLTQKSHHWSFNYWARESRESAETPYPDDLDDTFCALSAISLNKPELITGGVLAHAATMLAALEEKEGGPYKTWLVPETAAPAWKDIDLAVNGNIAYFLSLQDISLPSINSMIEKAAKSQKFSSPYYVSPYPAIYFISRFFREKTAGKIINFLLSKEKDGRWSDPLNTALAVSALINLGHPKEKLQRSVAYLLKTRESGKWSAFHFGIELVKNGKNHYSASSSLTTAFCVEALAKFQMAEKANAGKTPPSGKSSDPETESAYDRVLAAAKKEFQRLDGPLKTESLAFLEIILRKDQDRQIVLTPFFFQKAVGAKGAGIPRDLITNLCLANLLGWMAYTVYDDFIDGEGRPGLLPVANICFRRMVAIFENVLPDKPSFKNCFSKTMDRLEAANSREIKSCGIPTKGPVKIPKFDESKLCDRSFGHALGPMAIMLFLGYGERSEEIRSTEKFFRSYLSARQLNDDAHDWEEDLKRGRINAAGAELLGRLKLNTAEKLNKIPFAKLQHFFWKESIDAICLRIEEKISSARKNIGKIPLENREIIGNFLEPIERSVQKARREKEEAADFLKTY